MQKFPSLDCRKEKYLLKYTVTSIIKEMNFMDSLKYTTQGTCSREIQIELKDGVIDSVKFTGGCHGNLQGVSALVKGMKPEEAISRLKGIRCGAKPTSCPDQLAIALEQMLS